MYKSMLVLLYYSANHAFCFPHQFLSKSFSLNNQPENWNLLCIHYSNPHCDRGSGSGRGSGRGRDRNRGSGSGRGCDRDHDCDRGSGGHDGHGLANVSRNRHAQFFQKKGIQIFFDFSEKIWILDFLVGLKTALPLTKISGTFLIGFDTSKAPDPDLRLLDLFFTDILDLV